MNQPSPCPQCRSERVWARAALGAYGITHVAFCPGCARAATLCGRCGGELVLLRHSSFTGGRPQIETVLQCPTCRQTAASIPHTGRQAPVTPATGRTQAPAPVVHGTAAPAVERSAIRRFAVDAPAPAVVQRVADDFEQNAAQRYVRHRRLAGLIDEAARRADAMARLEIELRRLEARGNQA